MNSNESYTRIMDVCIRTVKAGQWNNELDMGWAHIQCLDRIMLHSQWFHYSECKYIPDLSVSRSHSILHVVSSSLSLSLSFSCPCQCLPRNIETDWKIKLLFDGTGCESGKSIAIHSENKCWAKIHSRIITKFHIFVHNFNDTTFSYQLNW